MNVMNPILASIVFAGIGIFVFVIGFYIIDKLTPYKLWNEIVEKQNQALAILVGSCALAIGIIVASAIH